MFVISDLVDNTNMWSECARVKIKINYYEEQLPFKSDKKQAYNLLKILKTRFIPSVVMVTHNNLNG